MGSGKSGRWVGGLAIVWGLAAVPTVAGARALGPSTVADAPAVVRALASVVLVGLVGVAFLARYRPVVDRGVEDTMDRPLVGIVYGLFAYVLVLFAGFYANDLFVRAGVAGTPVGYVALAILASGLVLVTSFGFLVVGTVVTDLSGGRRPWHGLLLGALLSGTSWLLLPAVAAIGACVLVAAVGIGGATRSWVHRERPVHAELES